MPVHTCPLEGAVEQRMARTQRPATQCCGVFVRAGATFRSQALGTGILQNWVPAFPFYSRWLYPARGRP